jgi:thioesterase domain-containing protein
MNQAAAEFDKDSSGPAPFILVARMFGNVLNLRHLAAQLGDRQPVFAVQARGLRGDDQPHRRFEEMAEDYLAEIRTVQQDGPYLLGGFSGGGITAFEMAQQLIGLGDQVALLVMLDSIPAEMPRAIMQGGHISAWDKISIHLQRIRRRGPAYLYRWLRDRVEWELDQRALAKNDPTHQEQTPAEFRSAQIEQAFREALMHYDTKPYHGDVVLFRPQLDNQYYLSGGRIVNTDREYVDHANHWGPYVIGEIDVRVMPGNHDSMVLEPAVRVLARELRTMIEEAQYRKADLARV